MHIRNPKILNLNTLAYKLHNEYIHAKPYPSIIIDDFFAVDMLDKVLEEFPNLSENAEDEYHDENQNEKYTNSRLEAMKPHTQSLIQYLNSAQFLQFLQILTGIKETLTSDPYLEGGGFHEVKQGGFLKLHVDFNKHYRTKLDRRINVLIFLNKDWKEEYGGEIELWDEQLVNCGLKALPFFNRMVIFNTNSTSFHGHPNPLNCPSNRSRKSIALYYYSHGRPEEDIVEGMEVHSTIFKGRTLEEIKAANDARKRYLRKQFYWSLIPPIAFQIRRKFIRWMNSF